MKWREINPWRPTLRVPLRRAGEPLLRLQDEMSRLFDHVVQPVEHFFGGDSTHGFVPRVNVYETAELIRITAELPGCHADDFEVSLLEDALVIKGERKEHHEEESGGVRYVESAFGVFERVVPLTGDFDRSAVNPEFKNGMLVVELRKLIPSSKGAVKLSVKSV